jgi:alpha-beta hydrolase superfamily lysophospholipase
MSEKAFQLPVAGWAPLHVHRWLPSADAQWVVLIVHGLGEHGGRYARFAEALSAAGAAVYAPDLPGHGMSAGLPADRGHFADHGGWTYVMQGIAGARAHAEREHPQRPLFIFGHSMGSFAVQHHLVAHSKGLAGAVLSATNGSMGKLRPIAEKIVHAEARLFGPRYRSELMRLLTFHRYNFRFAPTRTDYDWLSRDLAEIDKRMADPLIGFTATSQLWIDLLGAGRDLLDRRRLDRIRKELPVILISGSDDGVTDDGRGAEVLAAAYERAGLRDVTVKIYPHGRHELLNDTCRDQVTADLIVWLQLHLSAKKRTSKKAA